MSICVNITPSDLIIENLRTFKNDLQVSLNDPI